MAKIEPRTLKGFRDFLPEEQIVRQKFIDTVRASFEAFGFEPLETPALEYADILVGKYGDEGDKLMYRFKDNGDRDVALRYDLTIPLARVAAQYGDLKKPWKRYQISPVWRADNTQKGRFREFYQSDADIVGTSEPTADAEVLALSAFTLRKLGVSDFIIRVNSREILKGFYGALGLGEGTQVSVMRTIDKIDKIGQEKVRGELAGLCIPESDIDAIIEFSAVRVSDFKELLDLRKKFKGIDEAVLKLSIIIDRALTLDPDLNWVADFSIARGLDYYTGLIFETNLTKAPQYGSVLSGGRYDNLIGMFSNRAVPAVGASVGLDRLLAALEELKVIEPQKSVAKALVVNFDEKYTPKYLWVASELRRAGINTLLYFDAADLKKQLSYADTKGIQYALIYGENEAKEKAIVVKDLKKGSQEKVALADLVAYLSK